MTVEIFRDESLNLRHIMKNISMQEGDLFAC